VQALVSRITDRRVITYGFNPQADVRAENLVAENGGTKFDVVFRDPATGTEIKWDNMFLPMAGRHNTQNVLSAIAVVREMGASEDQIRDGLAGFEGVKRRFTPVGEVGGVRIIDDYGHHPVEISAVLQAAREVTDGKVWAVMQPHRYSRLHDLFDDFCTCFNDADGVCIADVYAAGEVPIEGADRDGLVEGIRAHGHRDVTAITRNTLADVLAEKVEPGDLIVCLGAGDITTWAHELPMTLKKALG